ncbi:diacylglycerol/lipid kinase family protein [Ornithinimicrobium avium]|uniref:DAGKc domain-containing protein n=1 Tax=Ornithinimicrobium avium TaxID=2283195 RepID=A0A345NK08_9MICO|nr:diacylglycerol kinase family protein [Ornithinimicrobium avium]AXH95366.1 hypothetical protein DV701_03780 [Ornithinimicrobium avium]
MTPRDGGPPRVAVVVNPVSRAAADAVRAVRAACGSAHASDPLVLETTVEEPGGPQTGCAVSRGVDRVVVAGGDGTVREVAGALAGAEAALGVVPAGTANLFARSALLPLRDPGRAARLAVSAEPRPTDLGEAVLTSPDGTTSHLPFLVVAGLGHDAATLAAVRPQAKARLRWLAYFAPGLGRLGSPGHALGVRLDDEELETGPLWSVLAVNAARLPAGARVVPGARLDDGLLHVVLVSPRGPRDWVRIARAGLGRTAPGDHPSLRYRSGTLLEVTAPAPVLAQVDGDVVPGVTGARLVVRPGVLLVAR